MSLWYRYQQEGSQEHHCEGKTANTQQQAPPDVTYKGPEQQTPAGGSQQGTEAQGTFHTAWGCGQGSTDHAVHMHASPRAYSAGMRPGTLCPRLKVDQDGLDSSSLEGA